MNFLYKNEPLLTVMVQADNPKRIKELIDKSKACGADAFGMQFEQMLPEFRSKEVYKDLFEYAGNKPVYVTNYRFGQNEGKSDEVLTEELVEFTECGNVLCDLMGDLFSPTDGELTTEESAIEKQIKLIEKIHSNGSQVIMSSHIKKYVSAEQVFKTALEHQRRGADISKIVTFSNNLEEQIENIKINALLKDKINIPYLFLTAGNSHIIRRVGGMLGSCMYLCIYEQDAFSTNTQPILKELKTILDNFRQM